MPRGRRIRRRARNLTPQPAAPIAAFGEEPAPEDLVPDVFPAPVDPAPLAAAPTDSPCCQPQRERHLQGDTVVILTTHQPRCPVWSAR
ncbi:hypothetical protein [Streptacidiphilus sp. MAP12-16]|uniref:hypothetical protein n=1 Tax=Streptacidiphilus sp. MAP12-16 TaxID=3156300 RepID=UPI0035113C32